MIRKDILLLLVGMWLVTFIPRILPYMILSKVTLSERAKKWFNYIPVSVFSAILFKELFYQGNHIGFDLGNPAFYIALIVGLIMYKFKSMGASIVIGCTFYYMISLF